MKLGALLRAEIPLDDAQRATVAAECCAFLRAGGTLSLADWDSLSAGGRDILAVAGEAVERSRGFAVAEEAAHVQAEALRLARERRAALEAVAAGEAEAGA